MTAGPRRPQGLATRLVAAALVLLAFSFTRLPELPEEERRSLAAGFAFERHELPLPAGHPPLRSVRAVHPRFEHIAGWISAVGAAVALADLDGDGLANDLCWVDPRTDQVIVAPVPGTPPRYAPFALDPAPLPYDPETTAPMGCVPADLTENGAVDLLVYYWGRSPIAFLSRQGGAAPRRLEAGIYRPRELVSPPAPWYTNAATFADFDGDGHLDLVLGNYFQDGARLLGDGGPAAGMMQDSMSRAYNGGVNRLFLWAGAEGGPQPEVRFREVDAFPGRLATGWTLALAAADLDGDLLPELYVANDFGPDLLLHNRSRPGQVRFEPLIGRRHFTTPRSKVLGHNSFKGMSAEFADLTGNGHLDLFVSNIATDFGLHESHFVFVNTGRVEEMGHGRAPFVDRSEPLGMARSGWGWDTRCGDFDNSGALEALQATGFLAGKVNRWPELHELAIGNDDLLRFPRAWPTFRPGDDLSGHQHNPFYVRSGDGRFYDLAEELGLDEPHVTRGIATADVSGDGRLDFVVANQWQPSYAYLNRAPAPGGFLGLHLRVALEPRETAARPGHPTADTLGRPAVGAQARVTLPDGRVLVGQVDGGNGHSGVRSPDLHFGLGEGGEGPLRVEIRWRDPRGTPRRELLELGGGWHTVLLGWEQGQEPAPTPAPAPRPRQGEGP